MSRRRPAIARWALCDAMAVLALLPVPTLAATDVLRPGPLDEPFATVSNPLGVPGWRGAMKGATMAGWLPVLVGTALATASVVRLRRARGVERQQLTLVLAVGAVVGGRHQPLMSMLPQRAGGSQCQPAAAAA